MPVVRIRGGSVLVDAADLHLLAGYNWRVMRKGNLFYAVAYKARSAILMHRLIMGAKSSESIDHANSAGLDNRRKNLRICTNAQNMMNIRKAAGTQSRYKGVGRAKSPRGWIARIMKDGKQKHLGTFERQRDAAREYDRAAVELFGEFARTNAMMGLYEIST